MLVGQDITVLGGGIGGFAAACALAMRGARVTVLEQAADISEVGAGLQISPNGFAVLDALGLGAAARERSVASRAVVLADGLTGREVVRMDLARLRPAHSFLLFHRADLLAMLAERAGELGVAVVTGARVARVEIGPEAAKLEMDGGEARDTGFLVGADGLHSVLRGALNGPRQPFFTGQVAWRALVPALGGEPAEATVWMGPGRHMVSYPLRGGSLVNLVAVEERKAWAEEGWHHEDDPGNFQRAFAQYRGAPRALIDRVEQVNIWGLFRHPVADQWHRGRAALLGDAAHPTLPFMAQGAVMALEDAWVLADALALGGLDEGPALYQARRRHRVERVIAAANANARNYHHANPLARLVGFGGLRALNGLRPEALVGRFDWIYGYDVTRS
ncbi:MAG: FAD-dependent monooxygenase [Maritimibacter sp.]|nr:FAD-dependent monooxygenase [Maritimibacter sp.]